MLLLLIPHGLKINTTVLAGTAKNRQPKVDDVVRLSTPELTVFKLFPVKIFHIAM